MTSGIAQPGYRRATAAASVARELAFPVLAVVLIVCCADIRIPMGLPGHRGLIWLTLLVAVALSTQRRATVLAVGAAATVAPLAMHAASGAAGSARYLAAAVLLYAVSAVPVVRRRPWLLVLAAAPIHLVALVDSAGILLGRVHLSALVAIGMPEKALCHLGFGLMAGLLGWAVAAGSTHFHRLRERGAPS